MHLIGYLLNLAIDIYFVIIIAQVAVSWLVAFDIINAGNRAAQNLISLLRRATEPVYRPLRKYIPPIGGIDLTPLVVMIGLSLIRSLVIAPLFFG